MPAYQEILENKSEADKLFTKGKICVHLSFYLLFTVCFGVYLLVIDFFFHHEDFVMVLFVIRKERVTYMYCLLPQDNLNNLCQG